LRVTREKKRFHGNQHTKNDEEPEEPNKQPTTLEKKIRRSDESDLAKERAKPDNILHKGYRIVQWSLFEDLCSKVQCKCGGNLTVSEEDIRGLGFKLVMTCSNCENNIELRSCPMLTKRKNVSEVNSRAVVAACMVGLGKSGLDKFCYTMDLPQPERQQTYDIIVKNIESAARSVCEDSMKRAVEEEKAATLTKTGDQGLKVSGDGSWRKPGFDSLQGFASIIGHFTQKVLDIEPKNRYCKKCELMEAKVGTEEYFEYIEEHPPECQANHHGSAASMEAIAVVDMFRRSEEKYNAQYHDYIGDGDSKTIKEIIEAKP